MFFNNVYVFQMEMECKEFFFKLIFVVYLLMINNQFIGKGILEIIGQKFGNFGIDLGYGIKEVFFIFGIVFK